MPENMENQINAEIDKDGEAEVFITKDKLQAFLQVTPPVGKGKPCTLEKVKELLARKNIVYGIKEENLQKALEPENWGKRILIAQGEAARDGENARIVYHFPLPQDRVGPRIDEKGRADYYDLGLIHNVKMGDFLAEKIPATEGVAGKDITGRDIPPKRGKDVMLPRGKNTIADEENLRLFAAIDGNVTIIDNKVTVSPVFQVNGDIDYSTGNIDFVGSVVINGNVNTGFKVYAAGDIEVKGFIEGAEVVAGGNVVVKGGIVTGQRGLVKAGGNIYARFIENSRVEAENDIIIREAIIQSTVRAGGSVRVTDRRASIIGGKVQACQEVEAKFIGSQLATPTVIEVGVNPQYREEYQKIFKNLPSKKNTLENIAHNLQIIQKANIAPEKLDPKRRIMLMKLLDEFKKLRKEIAEMEERLNFLSEEMQKITEAKVKVWEVVYPGVRIILGQSIYIVDNPIKYSAFVLEEGEVRIAPLS
ncbi:hypothetical protein SAMN02745221_00510 [Thermosyntropha lipolytica DSM 11003]|uniref:Flagellar Assembly Protein A N-terminal region domain-containing protein n=1 Tax=Thermosyntropha lipolytica DSM 11003 TaxID=1123382 RepID=A0A1M5KXH4_9FIRM|nr:FapA family protein [Thermosyntropha lipolytica]SHG57436.1 hypothetical protein SAMN02745221_00510 [Thermosyntropha lipolytica DSM 11003]